MTKVPPTPAMPMGVKWDTELSIIDNAVNARAYDRHRRRTQAEHNARVLARRVFHTDELEFSYAEATGIDIPTFVIEDELFAFGNGEFSLIEMCSSCGKEPKGRPFGSIATLGRVLEERDEADVYVCRVCQIIASRA